MNYTFHPEAEQEFIESAFYYETKIPGLGEQFAFEIKDMNKSKYILWISRGAKGNCCFYL